MLKIKQIYAKKSPSEAGFTLLEVLVAMLIAFFFVLGSMQALVLSTALRVKAQERQRANQLIQEDIEQIRFIAKELATNNSLCSANTFDTDKKTYLTPDPTHDPSHDLNPDSYAESLWESLPSEPADKQLLDGKGKTYKLTRTLAADSSKKVISTAKVLKIDFSVSPLDSSGFIEIRRDENGNPIKDGDGNNIPIVIATDHIEVIPNAAIEECPN